MRFSDLFISYKIGLKEIKSTIPFTKLPLYRKIAVITLFSISILCVIFFIFNFQAIGYITLLIEITLTAFYFILDSRKNNLKVMLEKHYLPYSKERMDMIIKILKHYEIDIYNSDLIDLLISEAEVAQIQCDYLALLKRPLKTVSVIIIPTIAYFAKKIGDTVPKEEIITTSAMILIILLLFFSLVFALIPIIKIIFYHDYNKYTELIYDLKQIKIFYTIKKSPQTITFTK
ncbi:MAG: hypothetical protein HFG34_11350 [Eubacterium sp.]|nr:hypothetical protein [Eubacterium sp.]